MRTIEMRRTRTWSKYEVIYTVNGKVIIDVEITAYVNAKAYVEYLKRKDEHAIVKMA